MSGCKSYYGQKFIRCGKSCIPEVIENSFAKFIKWKNSSKCEEDTENGNVWFIVSMVVIPLMFIVIGSVFAWFINYLNAV